MDFHAKERIVGAVVLVALAVWLIPKLLDGPESEPAATVVVPELQLPLPEEVAPVRTESIDLPAPAGLLAEAQGDEPADGPASEPPAVVRTSPEAEAEAQVFAAALDEAPPPVRAPTRQASAGSAAWSVQAGAFGERANAVQLAGRVAEYGYDADVSEFQSNGQPMHRVRVDGFATREQADAVASSLSAHGIPARVMPAD